MIDGKGLTRSSSLFDRMNHFNAHGTNRTHRARTCPRCASATRPLRLKLCRNVLLRDFTIYKGGHFGVLARAATSMTIDNVTMDTDRDGIDVDCCRNTTVSNCRINSPGDDGICPKSTFALGRNVITENLTIVNCQVSGFVMGTLLDGTMKPRGNGNGRIKFGTEANGGFRNVTVANCTFRACRGLALEEVDGGIMENITINNISMIDVPGYPIYITTGKRNRGPNVTQPSRMRRILISNVIATDCEPMSGIQITGLPEQPIEGVRLENIRLDFKAAALRSRPSSATGIGHRLSRAEEHRHHASLRGFCPSRARPGTRQHSCEFRAGGLAPGYGLRGRGWAGNRQLQSGNRRRREAGAV